MAGPGDKEAWEDKDYPLHDKLTKIRPAAQVDPAQYAAIFFAGGHACCADLPYASGLKRIAAAIYESGGVVGAVCHGPAIFQHLTLSTGRNILEGREATGFSTRAEETMGALEWMRDNGFSTMQQIVESAGARWSEHASDPMAEYTRSSDRVCTGMNPASAAAVARDMLVYLPQENEYAPQAIINKAVADSGNTIPGKLEREAMDRDAVEKGRTFEPEARPLSSSVNI